MKRFLFLILLGAIGAFLFRTFAYEGIFLASDSMAPTYTQGRHVFVNKFILNFRGVKRGDIIMFETPQVPEKGFVKRVIAVGGDVIAIRKKKVYLNNRSLAEPYVQFLRPDTILLGDNLGPIQVPEGFLFVMGDNRDYSGDSRDWKNENGEWVPYVPVDMVMGLIEGAE